MTAEQQAMTLSMLVATLSALEIVMMYLTAALEMTYCWVTLEMTK